MEPATQPPSKPARQAGDVLNIAIGERVKRRAASHAALRGVTLTEHVAELLTREADTAGIPEEV